jgi:hypothetical protein
MAVWAADERGAVQSTHPRRPVADNAETLCGRWRGWRSARVPRVVGPAG